MGCDIHFYIEYKGGAHWWSACSPHLMRDYTLFGLLAGVRRGDAIIAPRGIPDDVGWEAEEDYTLWIDTMGSPDINAVTRTEARDALSRGISVLWKCQSIQDKYAHITNPDWHTPSWLTYGELCKVYDAYRAVAPHTHIDFEACLAMMKCYVNHGEHTRAVFWFDN